MFLNWKGDKLSWLLQSDDFKLKHPSHCFLHSTILNTHKIFKFWSPRKTLFVKFSSRVFWIDLFRNHQDYFFVVLSIYIYQIYMVWTKPISFLASVLLLIIMLWWTNWRWMFLWNCLWKWWGWVWCTELSEGGGWCIYIHQGHEGFGLGGWHLLRFAFFFSS